MIKNYFKLALRNIVKNKFFSLLNILGLAIGMSACLTVILIIRDQLSYDRFHDKGERVYRINCVQNEGHKLASTPFPLGETLKNEFDIAESNTSLIRNIYKADILTQNQKSIVVNGFFTDSDFFKVFSFRLESGNPSNALSDPNTIVLSKKTAEKLFGNQNPIGESVTLKGKGVFKITGIAQEQVEKSHIKFDCLASVSTMISIEKLLPPDQFIEKVLDNWNNRFMTYTYLRLKDGKTKSDLDKVLAIIQENRKKMGGADKNTTYFAQNLLIITPSPEQYSNEMSGGVPYFFIYGLIAFVIILTIFPSINYANLSIAQTLSRVREVGIRKTIGASGGDIRWLIITEAVTTSMMALILAYIMHLPINHFVGTYFPPRANLSEIHAQGWDWVIFIGFGLLVGIVSGWIPAQRISKLEPSLALRGQTGKNFLASNKFGLRSVMLLGQFVFSLVLLIVVATLWSQMRYMTLADYGFQKENVLTIELQGNKPEVLAHELEQNPRVLGVTTTSVVLASNNLQAMELKKERNSEHISIHSALVDENFVPVLGLKMLAGENFPKRSTESNKESVILNEKSLGMYQFSSPADAIGKTLWLNDSTSAIVCGVIRDFHYRIFENAIEPFALRYSPLEKGYIMQVRIVPGDPRLTLAGLESIWKKLDKTHTFKATFMEESIQKSYGDIVLFGGIASFFALLSISIACMGLLGMVTYSVSKRVKEIGIRKIMGASVVRIVTTLSNKFIFLFALSILISLPIGYILANKFLGIFAYRISVDSFILGFSSFILFALVVLIVGIQSVRAAVANPIKSLRTE